MISPSSLLYPTSSSKQLVVLLASSFQGVFVHVLSAFSPQFCSVCASSASSKVPKTKQEVITNRQHANVKWHL